MCCLQVSDHISRRFAEVINHRSRKLSVPRSNGFPYVLTFSRKCTGDNPCAICAKNNIECRFEEIQRRKPRAVLLEERVGASSTPSESLN